MAKLIWEITKGPHKGKRGEVNSPGLTVGQIKKSIADNYEVAPKDIFTMKLV